MPNQNLQLLLVSDFTTDILRGYLSNSDQTPQVTVDSAPYGQFFQTLAGETEELKQPRYDAAVVWTQPASVIASFKLVLSFKPPSIDQIIDEVDQFCSLLLQFQDSAGTLLVPTWVIPTHFRGYGMLDMDSELGIAGILMRMNLRLSENLKDASNIYVLNTQKWIEAAGAEAFNEKLWYLGKVPFGNPVFKSATADIKSALSGVLGAARKLVIVDLDDTLWGGIVGDDGWRNLKLGGHDAVGEAFVDFQQALKSLANRGILLGIVSKNTEAVALEAMQSHPEMVLKQEDFAGWRINWNDKAQNILELVSDLSLGLQSTVFIDDNPVERARVRDALPEVLVPEWPENKMQYCSTLLGLPCFDTPSISQEDRERTNLYTAERERKSLKKAVGSVDDWLKSLQINVSITELNEADLQRTVQLLNKTNQMNLSTRRLTESELLGWLQPEDRKMWICRVSDKFGESGLTGIVSLEMNGKSARVVDFILSCRVMGRKVEEALLHTVIDYARSAGMGELCAVYIPTAKNQPCFDFWRRSGLLFDERQNTFTWRLDEPYPAPAAIALDCDTVFNSAEDAAASGPVQ